jgi:hypothetical protein
MLEASLGPWPDVGRRIDLIPVDDTPPYIGSIRVTWTEAFP